MPAAMKPPKKPRAPAQTNAERQQARLDRLREEGGRRLSIALSGRACQAIEDMRERMPNVSDRDLIEHALIDCAASLRRRIKSAGTT